MFKTLTAVALVLTAGLAAAQDYQAAPRLQPEQQEQIRQAVGNPHRTISNLMRDAGRNPEQTLSFFAVEPQHTVVEVWPGAGWYTEILAPLLREQGRYIAAHFDPQSPVGYFRQSRASFEEKLAGKPDVYDKVEVTVLNYEPDVAMAPPESADRVLTFRNVHNWLGSGQAEGMFAGFFEVLRPGGVLGVVDHRAADGMAEYDDSGYVGQDRMIALAEAAGFQFDASSEVNANPRDTKDHPNGVWTLPPTNRHDEADAQTYRDIGESDRMTLRFVKPE